MTILHPFRRHRDDEVADLRRQVRMLTALVDDVIDAWTSMHANTLTSDNGGRSGALVITGPIHGQDMTITTWSCEDTGRGLSVDQAKAITRQHLECPGDNPRICRIKAAAMALLIDEGVLVPARNYSTF
ncbi:hypothetical protein IU459_32815 [Nocardia amamiensis]|uniref:DUF222 domain-containing protein n=1 Tax=Nocardia amamiensis TaxID=404578 RepID=A0ABS0D0C5_9NOCA|nr:hypothetical protein [Nocardia amamiensis]MBF6302288.1 hypothetical protein [Nocardia amamiensis]